MSDNLTMVQNRPDSTTDADFRAVFDHASTGMTLVDDSGRYVRVNRAFADLLGVPAEELTGRYFGDFTFTSDHDTDVALVGELISGARRVVVREKRYRHRDGTPWSAMVSSSIIRPVDGGPWQLLNTIESLVDRRAARQRLAELDSAVDGIITVDDGGLVVAWNHGAERLLGRTGAVMIGMPLRVVIPERARPQYDIAMAGLVAGGSPLLGSTVEVPAVHADGRELLTELTLSTWAHDGHPRYTAIVRDVTVQRRAERAAALIRHAAVTANSADTFAAAAADVLREVCTRLGWTAGHALTSDHEPAVWHIGDH
ncbi:MAG TPA: PAS domain S-box protein, partial [Actinoplanes sp.]|nr:PAS domain S-box protein [Actinoplanes sp.]